MATKDAEAEGCDRKVMPLEPQDRPPHEKGNDGRDGRPRESSGKRVQTELDRKHGDRVGAYAEEARVPETDLPRIAHQQVEPDDRQGRDPHERGDTEVEIGGKDKGEPHHDDGNQRRNRETM